jgi:hypothetical protein
VTADAVRVKFIARGPGDFWLHQFPGNEPVWGGCAFVFDREARDYDWLVVYDDVPPRAAGVVGPASEPLACDARNTLLVTTEPSSIKTYGDAFTGQFGTILTSQEPWALPHPDRIYSQPALHWFYGVGNSAMRPFDRIAEAPPLDKCDDLSMVFSPKRMRHTLHHRRNRFMQALMDEFPGMAVFGRGARPLDDKAEALDAYRYHVAVENHIGLHHWTEKLADAYLGAALPFYCGCPNLEDYFPADSFIRIDMRDPRGAADTIRRAIAEDAWRQRLPAILEARRRVLNEYNLFAVLAREIDRRHVPGSPAASDAVLYSRHALRKRHFPVRVRDAWAKLRVRAAHLLARR